MDWTTIVVAALTAGGTTAVGRAARRTPRQEKRDDFAAVTARLDKDIERLDARLTRADARIAGQSSAIGYLHTLVRTLVVFTRAAGLEPPPAPQPPEDAKPFLHDIGV